MKLSILICSVEERHQKLKALMNELIVQRYKYEGGKPPHQIEIIVEVDNKEISVGKKRQNLLEKAKGEYVSFIDDDDWVAPNYVRRIMNAIEEDPDCIGFKINCTGTPGVTASASNKWDDWAENTGGFDYVRTIYHKSPVKREIALQIGYKDMRFGEDYEYSKRLKDSGLLKKEVFIDEAMYEYRFTNEEPNAKYGIKQ